MYDGTAGALQRLHGPADEVLARLCQHFDGHVIRNMCALDQLAYKIKIGLRGRGESHLDLLETDLAQHAEHAHLTLGIHGLEQRLVAVAQIRAHPDGRMRNDTARPLAISELNRRERLILGSGVLQHGGNSSTHNNGMRAS